MEFAMLRLAVCLLGCAGATYYDLFNRRNVPSWLSYSFVALGVLFTLATLNMSVITYSFSVAIVFFAVGYLLYRAGQIGGADVLVFVSIALLLPEAPPSILLQANSQLGFPFVISIFVLSSILAIFGIFFMYIPPILYDMLRGKKVDIRTSEVVFAAASLLVYAALLYYMDSFVEIPRATLVIFAAVIVCTTCIFAFKEYISDKYMIRMVRIDEIDEEDILAVEKMDPSLVSGHKLNKLLTPGEIEKLKKIGRRKKFPVYKEMPVFMPYVLMALIAALLFGDPLAYLFPLSLLG